MSDNKPIVKFAGERMDVSWDGRLCIHVAECGRSDSELFIGGRKPWCQPDLVDDDHVADVCERCPSGSLSYEPKAGQANEMADGANTVLVISRGPLFFRGQLDIDGAADDQPGLKFRAALCRCGHSKNKPFCDNSHEKAGFSDQGPVGPTGDEAADKGGPLQVKAAKDGPLLVNGNFSIVASSGRTRWQGKRAALCRCGESANKPFCDGSHKAANFNSE